jgi:hypothetical protein
MLRPVRCEGATTTTTQARFGLHAHKNAVRGFGVFGLQTIDKTLCGVWGCLPVTVPPLRTHASMREQITYCIFDFQTGCALGVLM